MPASLIKSATHMNSISMFLTEMEVTTAADPSVTLMLNINTLAKKLNKIGK